MKMLKKSVDSKRGKNEKKRKGVLIAMDVDGKVPESL